MRILHTLFVLVFSFLPNFIISQEREITITPELSYILFRKNPRVEYNVYLVQNKEVNYPIYQEGNVPSKKYKEQEERLNKFKKDYDAYESAYQKAENEFREQKSIITLIDSYLTSKEKRKEKEKYLIEAQKIVDKYNLKKSFFSSGHLYSPDIHIVLYNDGDRASDSNLEYYKKYVEKIEFKEPYKPYNYSRYLEELEILKNIPATEKGIIKANSSVKQNVLVTQKEPIDYKKIDGKYIVLSEKYHIVEHLDNDNIHYEVVPSSKIQNLSNGNEFVKISNDLYPLIKDTKTNDFYLVTPYDYVEELEKYISTQKRNFVFVKSAISRIEYLSTVKNNYEFATPELKKRMLGMYPITEIDEKVDYNTSKYIKFSTIPTDERFVMLIGDPSSRGEIDKDIVIQSLKTKQRYLLSSYAAMGFYNDRSNPDDGPFLLKEVQRELTSQEKQLVQKFKTLLKQGEQKSKILHSIQSKYLTRGGYFDPSKVKAQDKPVFNKNLEEVKKIYEKLKDILDYEDKNRIISNGLSTGEWITYENISTWKTQFQLN